MTYHPSPHGNRPAPEDLVLALLCVLLLLATSFTIGGLAAHPFAG